MSETYKRFETVPVWAVPVWINEKEGKVQKSDLPLWSGNGLPPDVGTRIKITMNAIGFGTVKGYFVEHGWLGLLVEPEAPPKWWREQNKGECDRLCHIFGIEFKPARAYRPRVATTSS